MESAVETQVFSHEEWDQLITEISLSPRQADLVQLLFEGHSDKQIARKLDIAIPTVRTHFSRLFSKFNIQDRHELIIHVFRHFRKGCARDECPRFRKNREGAIAMTS